MYYHIYLSDRQTGSVDHNGTNTILGNDTKTSNVKLTWKLLENDTAKDFANITKLVSNSTSRVLDWNHYHTGGSQTLPTLVDQLNIDIDSYPLHEDFKINLLSSKEDLYDKTNKIHYAFEKLLVESDPTALQKEILERLNKLVHEIEHNISNYFDNTSDDEHFIVCRHTCDQSSTMYKKLTDDDYNRFKFQNETGDLFLDFFTVGKDLGHAFMSNDLDLVKNKEIKQQEYITASVQISVLNEDSLGTYNPEIENQQQLLFEDWCTKNNVESYGYNYKEPKYNLGRCQLGSLVNETYDSFRSKLHRYPYITNVELTET